jgi:NAD kinase
VAVLDPRAVFVVRDTEYEALVAHHATRAQARFFLETRGQRIEAVEARHHAFHAALAEARARVPATWRQAVVRRGDLDRFLFADDDVVVAFGQDGLVANLAKYVRDQPVIGINPLPDAIDGVLVRHRVADLAELLPASAADAAPVERRTMVEAAVDGAETLVALNEIFVGHRSHQSARYHLTVDGEGEEQSSSGLIVASGTGATGWARSIAEATRLPLALGREEAAVGFWVREPFPSATTGTRLRAGKLVGAGLSVTSHMDEGGVIFADGIEGDCLPFDWGRRAVVAPAPRTLRLVAA